MNIIVSEEIKSVCPNFVGACVEAQVVNSPFCQDLWSDIRQQANIFKASLTTESLKEIPSK